jgi:Dyp-type peroxidase family
MSETSEPDLPRRRVHGANPEPTVDQGRPEIQAFILYGFKRLNLVRYIFLEILDADAARRYIGAVLPHINTSERRASKSLEQAIQIAFTGCGLTKIGLGDDTVGTFSPYLQAGMATDDSARVLGDTGASDPKLWEFGGRNPSAPCNIDNMHVMIALFTCDDALMDALHAEQAALWNGALRELHVEYGHRLPKAKEHFNFHDGIDEPAIIGSGDLPERGQESVQPGEFILSYTNGYNQPSRSPTTRADNDPKGLLPISIMYPDRRDLGRNGTYLVFRKLEQNVPEFWNFWRDHGDSKDEAVWLAAKSVGRWRSGAPLTLSPDFDDPTYAQDGINNDFLYLENDPHGLKCPVLSHIRRANPRDSIPLRPDLSLKEVSRHRIIRRGFSYGPFLDYETENVDGKLNPDGERRGLHFICFNSDIERQFVFLQQTWVNNAGFQGGVNQKDPLTGDCDGSNVMSIPREPAARNVNNLLRFVEMKGGGYFFFPSVPALRYLAWGGV